MSFNVSMCAWLCVCLSVCFVNLCYFVSKCLVFLFCQLPDGADEWNEIFSCCHGVMKSGFAGWVGTGVGGSADGLYRQWIYPSVLWGV